MCIDNLQQHVSFQRKEIVSFNIKINEIILQDGIILFHFIEMFLSDLVIAVIFKNLACYMTL